MGRVITIYKKLHSHNYDGETNFIFNHKHQYMGISSKDADFLGHVHYLSGYVSEVENHVHYLSVITGPEIKVENGHIHFYRGFTTFDDGHYHYFRGYTSIHSDF